jgi:cysteine synthase A
MGDREHSILDAIGHTPIVRIGNVYAKLEGVNPSGSIKDRVALEIIEDAERKGEIKKGYTIVEASSGNTGISLSMVAMAKGYHMVVVMPENMSEERKKIIHALGGETILSPAEKSLDGCLARVDELARAEPGKFFIAGQFENPHNPEIHYNQTAPEIWEDMKGEIDVFVAGVGSGGSVQGIGTFLKEKNPGVKIVAVEPKNSAALLGREPGLHQIHGIGDGFIPAVLDVELVDMVMTVSDEEAIETTRRLSREEGLLVGTSSGANVFAALHMDNGHNKVVTLLPDRAERYFSTALL